MASKIGHIFVHGWPFFAALFFIPFGSDLVAVYLLAGNVHGLFFIILPCLAGTADPFFWYWFFGWSGNRIAQAGKVREAIDGFNSDGLHYDLSFLKKQLVYLWNWLVGWVEDNINPKDGWKKRFMTRTLDLTHHFPPIVGYLVIASTPLIPSVGIYIGLIACRASKTKLPHAFPVLVVANLVKVFILTLSLYLALHRY